MRNPKLEIVEIGTILNNRHPKILNQEFRQDIERGISKSLKTQRYTGYLREKSETKIVEVGRILMEKNPKF